MRRVMFLLGLVCFVHPGPVIFWPTLNAFMWPSTWALFGGHTRDGERAIAASSFSWNFVF